MNAKQLAADIVVAIAIAASMPVALAHDEHHEGERPEVSPASCAMSAKRLKGSKT